MAKYIIIRKGISWDHPLIAYGTQDTFFILFYKIRLGEETIRGHTTGTRTPLLTFGNVFPLTLCCAMIISLTSTTLSPSQG